MIPSSEIYSFTSILLMISIERFDPLLRFQSIKKLVIGYAIFRRKSFYVPYVIKT